MARAWQDPDIRRLAPAVSLSVLLATSTVAMAAAPAGAEVSGGVTIPRFYDPPARLPAGNGAIVRTGKVTPAAGFTTATGATAARATRLMYKSTDSNGKRVAVTGTYFEPAARWARKGPRPLVSFSVGTQGQGDQCAPSLSFAAPGPGTPAVGANYETPNVAALLSKGVAVVVTDYVGLGTTDRLHTYVNRVDEGHAVLDAARAAPRVPGASVTRLSRVATYGYSQGGGASASAAELQPSYAPKLKLVGGYAGAPPADLTEVQNTIDGTSLTGAIGWSINGFLQAYPKLRRTLDAEINAEGRATLAAVKTQCVGETLTKYAYRKTSSWTKSGKSLAALTAADRYAASVLRRQRIGRLRPRAPVRIATGTKDDYVPHAQARRLAVDWCKRGVRVTYVPIVQTVPTGGTGTNHFTPLLSDGPIARSWVIDRLAGKRAGSSCRGIASLP